MLQDRLSHTSSLHACPPEQLLQVVRQLGAAPIALASGVERDKDARILVHIHLLLKEHHGLGLVLQSTLQGEFVQFEASCETFRSRCLELV